MRTAERVSADKLRGGFYSPPSLVRACLDRVAELAGGQDGLRVLEPSAGDGAFVRGLAGHEMARRVAGLTAVEINAAAAATCQAALDAAPFGGTVIPASVLGTARPRPGRYDIAVGNPPFVRFQFLSGDDRRGALGVARVGHTRHRGRHFDRRHGSTPGHCCLGISSRVHWVLIRRLESPSTGRRFHVEPGCGARPLCAQ